LVVAVFAMNVRTSSSVLHDLRALLTERFAQAHPAHLGSCSTLRTDPAETQTPLRPTLSTGLPAWDTQTGGLRVGEVSEICGPSGGTSLVMDALLEAFSKADWPGAWVDTADTFEVQDWYPEQRERLVWVRCGGQISNALKATDLLLRDGNCSWVVLDLQNGPRIPRPLLSDPNASRVSSLGPPSPKTASAQNPYRIPANHWHRFHRLVEQQGNCLVVLSPWPLVESVRVRIATPWSVPIEALERPRPELRAALELNVFVRGQRPRTAAPQPQSDPKAPLGTLLPPPEPSEELLSVGAALAYQRKTA
jgi:hypothetical protein